MLPLRAVSEWAFAASRELDSILPKVYDNYQTNMLRGMLPLRAVSERAFAASRELDSILPKVYDNYQTTTVPSTISAFVCLLFTSVFNILSGAFLYLSSTVL
jgi:hypothetical protein